MIVRAYRTNATAINAAHANAPNATCTIQNAKITQYDGNMWNSNGNRLTDGS